MHTSTSTILENTDSSLKYRLLLQRQSLAVPEKIQNLLKEIRASAIFEEEKTNALMSWEKKWISHLEEKDKIVLLLCELLFDIVLSIKVPEALKEVHKRLEHNTMFLIEEHLPEGTPLESFLVRFQLARQALKKINLIDQVYDRKKESLHQESMKKKEELESKFYLLKLAAKESHETTKTVFQSLKTELEETRKKIENQENHSQKTNQAILHLQNRIQTQDDQLSQILHSVSHKGEKYAT